jgi:hypothetical protein
VSVIPKSARADHQISAAENHDAAAFPRPAGDLNSEQLFDSAEAARRLAATTAPKANVIPEIAVIREEVAAAAIEVAAILRAKFPGMIDKPEVQVFSVRERAGHLLADLERGDVISICGITPEEYRADPRAAERLIREIVSQHNAPAYVFGDKMYVDPEHPAMRGAKSRRETLVHELAHIALRELPLQAAALPSDWTHPTLFQQTVEACAPSYLPLAARMAKTLRECGAIAMQYGFLTDSGPSKSEFPREGGHLLLWMARNLEPEGLGNKVRFALAGSLAEAMCRFGTRDSAHPVAYSFVRTLAEGGNVDVLIDLLKNPFVPGIDPKEPGNLSSGEKFKLTWKEFCNPERYLKRLGRVL